MSSLNDKLDRVRKPRVHIKYEVETEGKAEEKELPFTVGVMGDYAGNHPSSEKKALKDRKFVKVDRDNINNVMEKIKPGVKMRVENTMAEDGSEMNVELNFNSMADFEPENIVNNIPALKQLKDVRDKLRDLLSRADRSQDLEGILEAAMQDPDKLKQLAKELGIEEPSKQ